MRIAGTKTEAKGGQINQNKADMKRKVQGTLSIKKYDAVSNCSDNDQQSLRLKIVMLSSEHKNENDIHQHQNN